MLPAQRRPPQSICSSHAGIASARHKPSRRRIGTCTTTSSSVPAPPAACSPIALPKTPTCKVLLLEAGPRDWHPFIHMPAGLAKLVGNKGVNWDYDTAPEPQLDNRVLWWPRGKVLGGSSSINAMCYIRGVPADYDDWAAQGADGWDWDIGAALLQAQRAQRARRRCAAWRRRPAVRVRPALHQPAVAGVHRCRPAGRLRASTATSTARRSKASASTRSRRKTARAVRRRWPISIRCASATTSPSSPAPRSNRITFDGRRRPRQRRDLHRAAARPSTRPPRAKCCSAAARSIRRSC